MRWLRTRHRQLDGGSRLTNHRSWLARDARRADRKSRQQSLDFFPLGRITKYETHPHAEAGVRGQYLTTNLQFHFRSVKHNLDTGLTAERGWCLHVTATFTDIGKRAVIGHGRAEAIDFRPERAGQAALPTAIPAIRGQRRVGLLFCPSALKCRRGCCCCWLTSARKENLRL
jgi:hypothetical protein